MKTKLKFSFGILFLLLFINLGYAEEINKTMIEENAAICINESLGFIAEMNNSGFNVQRINEILKQEISLFDAQNVIKSRRSLNYDFSLILPYCEEIKTIRNLAFTSIESLNVLKKFYDSTIVPGIDFTEVDKTIKEIEGEIKSERYENVDTIISKAYEQITTVAASSSRLKALYSSASSSIIRFIYLNRIFLITILIIFVLFVAIFYKKIKIRLIKRQIRRLELRKKTIKGLIMNSQEEFFEKGNLSEGNYNIRVKKFGELILDIDRQIPLLNEELSKIAKSNPEEKVKTQKKNLSSLPKKLNINLKKVKNLKR